MKVMTILVFPLNCHHPDSWWFMKMTHTGPYIVPSSEFIQCLLDSVKNKPEDYFDVLFDNQVYMIMAEEINQYMH